MSEQDPKPQKKKGVQVKMPEEVAKGAYANTMAVFHTREEFVIDFLNVFPPSGIATARVITSPGHIKRIIGALQENLRRYEERFGPVKEAPPPTMGPMGYA
jgi:hypothetical protein